MVYLQDQERGDQAVDYHKDQEEELLDHLQLQHHLTAQIETIDQVMASVLQEEVSVKDVTTHHNLPDTTQGHATKAVMACRVRLLHQHYLHHL